jgi:hypothetical protein
MNFQDILFGLILIGIGLAGACFRCEYLLLREIREIERRRARVLHDLHMERLSSRVDENSEVLGTP